MTPATPADLDLIVSRLVNAISPEAIYLFGSYAKGEANSHSDVDLLVVVNDQAVDTHAIYAEGEHALWGIDVSTDLVVLRRGEINQWSSVPTSLPREVAQTGRVIYES